MRYMLLSILPIIVMSFAKAQSPHGYIKAYKRETISGVPPADLHAHPDSAMTLSRENNRFVYYIYGIGVNPALLNVKTIWLERQCFQVTISKVERLPILLHNPNHTDTLVGFTRYDVHQIRLKELAIRNPVVTDRQKQLILGNEIVIPVYKQRGRTSYYTLPKIIKLDPLIEQ